MGHLIQTCDVMLHWCLSFLVISNSVIMVLISPWFLIQETCQKQSPYIYFLYKRCGKLILVSLWNHMAYYIAYYLKQFFKKYIKGSQLCNFSFFFLLLLFWLLIFSLFIVLLLFFSGSHEVQTSVEHVVNLILSLNAYFYASNSQNAIL